MAMAVIATPGVILTSKNKKTIIRDKIRYKSKAQTNPHIEETHIIYGDFLSIHTQQSSG